MTNKTQTNERKYSIGDLTRETLHGMYEDAVVKGVRKGIRDTLETISTLYAIPTMNRRLGNRGATMNEAGAKIAGSFIAGISPLVIYFVAERKFGYLAVPLTTNGVSWAYEHVRDAKKRLEEKAGVN